MLQQRRTVGHHPHLQSAPPTSTQQTGTFRIQCGVAAEKAAAFGSQLFRRGGVFPSPRLLQLAKILHIVDIAAVLAVDHLAQPSLPLGGGQRGEIAGQKLPRIARKRAGAVLQRIVKIEQHRLQPGLIVAQHRRARRCAVAVNLLLQRVQRIKRGFRPQKADRGHPHPLTVQIARECGDPCFRQWRICSHGGLDPDIGHAIGDLPRHLHGGGIHPKPGLHKSGGQRLVDGGRPQLPPQPATVYHREIQRKRHPQQPVRQRHIPRLQTQSDAAGADGLSVHLHSGHGDHLDAVRRAQRAQRIHRSGAVFAKPEVESAGHQPHIQLFAQHIPHKRLRRQIADRLKIGGDGFLHPHIGQQRIPPLGSEQRAALAFGQPSRKGEHRGGQSAAPRRLTNDGAVPDMQPLEHAQRQRPRKAGRLILWIGIVFHAFSSLIT